MQTAAAWLREQFENNWYVYSDGSYDEKTIAPNIDPVIFTEVLGYEGLVSDIYSISSGGSITINIAVTDANDRHAFPGTLRVVWYIHRTINGSYDATFLADPLAGYQNENTLSYVFDSSLFDISSGGDVYTYEIQPIAVDDECGCSTETVKIQITEDCDDEFLVLVTPCDEDNEFEVTATVVVASPPIFTFDTDDVTPMESLFTVTNPGPDNLRFSIVASDEWIEIEHAWGQVLPGSQSTDFTVTVYGDAAHGITATGTYYGTIKLKPIDGTCASNTDANNEYVLQIVNQVT